MSNFNTFSPVTEGYTGDAVSLFTADTNDNLATITASAYMDDLAAASIVKVNDQVFINYDVDGTEGSNQFTVEFVASHYNLVAAAAQAGTVIQTGASVVGNLPKYNTTTGGIIDSGISPTNAALTKSVMVNGATNIGDFALFSDNAGTVSDSNAVARSGAFGTVVVSSASNVVGHLLKAFDTTGTTADAGVAAANVPYAYGKATFGGGGTTTTVTVTGMVAGDTIIASLNGATTTVPVKYVAGTGSFVATFTADPGAGTVIGWAAIH